MCTDNLGLLARSQMRPLPCYCGCLQDVKFGAANLPAMKFIGGGAQSYQEWLDFLGQLKDERVPPVGSPFQQNFRPGEQNAARNAQVEA